MSLCFRPFERFPPFTPSRLLNKPSYYNTNWTAWADMACKRLLCRLSLLEVVEGVGQHHARRQRRGESSGDGEEEPVGSTREARPPGTSGEECWLSMVSRMAEEAAVSHGSRVRPSLRGIFLIFRSIAVCNNTYSGRISSASTSVESVIRLLCRNVDPSET